MDNIIPFKIQLITFVVSLTLTIYSIRLILKGKLREEYAIFWFIMTFLLIVFSIWRDGLTVVATLFGVFDAPNLVFSFAIFSIFFYILHLTLTLSKLQNSNKELNQEIGIMKHQIKELQKKISS
jgi:hypothetical protein